MIKDDLKLAIWLAEFESELLGIGYFFSDENDVVLETVAGEYLGPFLQSDKGQDVDADFRPELEQVVVKIIGLD